MYQQKQDPTRKVSFIVGDVRGRYRLLSTLLRKVYTDPKAYPMGSDDNIIIMGNFINPKSHNLRSAVSMMKTLEEKLPNSKNLIFLRGPNENKFVKLRKNYLKSPECERMLREYRLNNDTKSLKEDKEFLAQKTRIYLNKEGVFITTGGANALRTVEQQLIQPLMFFRGFVSYDPPTKKFEKILVHSGELNKKVMVRKDQVSLSTEDEMLCCTVIDETTGEVLEVISVTKDEVTKD